MNRLVQYISGCDLSDVASLRRLYDNNFGNTYYYKKIALVCEPVDKKRPELVNITVKIRLSELEIPDYKHFSEYEKIALADFCLRSFYNELNALNIDHESRTIADIYKGKFIFHMPGPEMVVRNHGYITNDHCIAMMLVVLFPVHMMEKRRVVNGKKSTKMIRKELVHAIRRFIDGFHYDLCMEWLETSRIQNQIRKYLEQNRFIGFIADGSILPRRKDSTLPMNKAVEFVSPNEDRIKITLGDGTVITGLGMKEGVNVITGGGYSGKSTLMDALVVGVYNHIPGDGREFCIMRENAVKIEAEDGRPIVGTDISAFITKIPFEDPTRFYTLHASGSTSQAANIIEALEVGSKVLLLDEDKTATNFMIRDQLMKQIIKNDPIIPFTDRVRQLYEEKGVSTILIVGGSSEYLSVADYVYYMEDYRIHNFNKQLKRFDVACINEKNYLEFTQKRCDRKISTESLIPYKESVRRQTMSIINESTIEYGENVVDIGHIRGFISHEQMNGLLFILKYLQVQNKTPSIDIKASIDKLYDELRPDTLDTVFSFYFNIERSMELPRKYDVLFALYRMIYLLHCDED